MTELGTITQTLLPATAPYDLGCTLRALAGFRPGLRDVGLFDGMVRRAFTHPADPQSAIVTQVTERDDGAPGVRLTVFSEAPLAEADLDAVGRRVNAWLGLDDERAEFLRIAEADEHVRPLLALTAGLHQPRFSSLAEAAVYFALVQNSAEWYATLRKRRLTLHLGPTARVEGVDYTAFPEFPLLTTLSPTQLLPYVGVASKAAPLADVLAGVAALDEELLRHGPYEEARAALLSVRGVGDYTAHALLLRALGRPDAVPLEMEQFVNIAVSVYGDPPPAPSELRERYGPWVGWWAYSCRTALAWLDQERRARERAERLRQRSATARRPRTPSGSTRPRAAGRGRQPAPWSPTDPGPAAVDALALATAPAPSPASPPPPADAADSAPVRPADSAPDPTAADANAPTAPSADDTAPGPTAVDADAPTPASAGNTAPGPTAVDADNGAPAPTAASADGRALVLAPQPAALGADDAAPLVAPQPAALGVDDAARLHTSQPAVIGGLATGAALIGATGASTTGPAVRTAAVGSDVSAPALALLTGVIESDDSAAVEAQDAASAEGVPIFESDDASHARLTATDAALMSRELLAQPVGG
ncbi:hypothetical protein [Dactylosporangium sp. CA-139066]|uniref:DNA-3-methyladenine glycosylase family protein n=1 Tax=Dactylosporangium sp. CA-139066 TaxID=3239930 RepID=UPI003D89C1F8